LGVGISLPKGSLSVTLEGAQKKKGNEIARKISQE
jgi:hypothetical protein